MELFEKMMHIQKLDKSKNGLSLEVAIKAREYLENELSQNTKLAYRTDLIQFKKFCDQHEMSYTSEVSIISYITNIAEKFKIATIYRKISALSKFYSELELEINPTKTHKVKRLIKSIAKTKGVKQKQAKPLSLDFLKEKLSALDTNNKINQRDKVLFLVGFAGAFRVSELINLKVSDINFNNLGASVFVRKSKTDQLGEGNYKALSFGRDLNFCPVRNLENWIHTQNLKNVDFLFSSISNKPIARQNVNKKIKRIFGKEFSTHSMRAGFVTTAKEKGASDSDIMNQTHHKTATMIRKYTRHQTVHQNNAVNLMDF